MGTEEEHWNIYKASQYLPAVLTDPHRGKQSNFFTKTWGDTFIEKTEIEKSPFLPEITYAHFDQYLRKYSKRFKRHLRLAQTELEDSIKHRKSDNFVAESRISCIPEIYLRHTFNLSDPKVFLEVFGNKDKSEHELQDELSFYLDIVEEHIAKQVSQKSGAFFHAMTSHDTIMEQMGVAVSEVRLLRFKVQRIDKSLATEALRLLGLQRSKCNQIVLVDKLKLMSTVLQTQPTLQLLLSSSDFVGALELISGTQEVLAKELAGVTSLRHLPSQLKEMLKLIDKMLSTEFERYAATDLHRPLDSNEGVLEQERLTSLVAGLLRQNSLHFLEIYKQEAVTAAQALLKQLMIEQLKDAEDELNELTGSGEVAPVMDSIRLMKILRLGSEALGKLLYRVKAVHDVIKETTDISAGLFLNGVKSDMERFLTEEDHKQAAGKLKDLLTFICDYYNERLASLVSTHSDNQSVTAGQIMELASIVEQFTNLCEAICGRQSAALKAAFKILAGNYVNKFHMQRKNKLTLLLDAERWKAEDVPAEIQLLLDKLAAGEIIKSLPSSPVDEKLCSTYVNKSFPALTVGSQTYVAIGTVIILLQLIAEYCVCAYDLQLLAPIIGRNLAELLRTFNSRSCQLVLGAGALRTAGLKTITSTNLALASRSLQLVLWLIPHIRNHFQSVIGDSYSGFDSVEKDIANHIQQLETKVLSIINILLGDQLNEWDAKPPIPSKQFRNISRHLTKLHEAVSSVLPEEQVRDIYEQVHKNFKTRIREQLLRMNIQKNGGPQHGVVTSEMIFYLQTMKMLKVLPEKYVNDNVMDDIWVK
ncbi:vacuolar protein sorting-associated protein 54 [Cylas formicarius]|uniref:vacuolar protein sorting-associated protein 54 n=1 Tax=Cylas formicarius TaxID=197179 RepID=UPI002958CD93|nr:vacuolar protein sorting-associated protein 54 [Cylas formicarius]